MCPSEKQNPSVCTYYRKDECESVSRTVLPQGEKRMKKSLEAEVVYIEKGNVELRDGDSYMQKAGKGELCFLPPGQSRTVHAASDSALIVFRMPETVCACDFPKKEEDGNGGGDGEEIRPEETMCILPVKKELKGFLDDLKTHIGNDSLCPRFLVLKTEELSLLLNAYYDETERRRFFSHEENRNSRFLHFVFSNHSRVKTVKEFAALSGFSLSAFEKTFSRIFGTAPYRWMMQKRIERLRHELLYGRKSLKEISGICGFASPSQMNDFCRKHLGMTPGKIRKNSL